MSYSHDRDNNTNSQSPFIVVDVNNKISDTKLQYLFTDILAQIVADTPEEINSALDLIDDYASKGKFLVGYFSFEAGCLLNGSVGNYDYPDMINIPAMNHLIWFGVFDKALPWYNNYPRDSYYLSKARPGLSLNEYKTNFNKIKRYILNGTVYQINYTFPVNYNFYGDVLTFFGDLRTSQQADYNFLFSFPEYKILSLSPELFFYKNRSHIWTKPMKGTMARDQNETIDKLNKKKLAGSIKNKAENAMITDILRNDFGKICETGSVKVEKIYEMEEYPTLYQMTSTVSGVLNSQVNFRKIFQALFPVASITGAPKYEATKLIHQLEKSPRGVYTGAIGIIQPDGQALFNVAIRTLSITDQRGTIGVGSGIVFDSRADSEYKESLLKQSFMNLKSPFLYIFETILFNGRVYILLELHLKRLCRSAIYFGFKYREKSMKTILENFKKKSIHHGKSYRVKLILFPDGNVSLETSSAIRLKKVYRIVIASSKVNSSDIFNYHKTNHRSIKDQEYKDAMVRGYDETLFLNEKNNLTECALHNICIFLKGRWVTPQLSSGLLPGVMREYLLQRSTISEKEIHLDELMKADKIVIINSVRGINKAVIDIPEK